MGATLIKKEQAVRIYLSKDDILDCDIGDVTVSKVKEWISKGQRLDSLEAKLNSVEKQISSLTKIVIESNALSNYVLGSLQYDLESSKYKLKKNIKVTVEEKDKLSLAEQKLKKYKKMIEKEEINSCTEQLIRLEITKKSL